MATCFNRKSCATGGRHSSVSAPQSTYNNASVFSKECTDHIVYWQLEIGANFDKHYDSKHSNAHVPLQRADYCEHRQRWMLDQMKA